MVVVFIIFLEDYIFGCDCLVLSMLGLTESVRQVTCFFEILCLCSNNECAHVFVFSSKLLRLLARTSPYYKFSCSLFLLSMALASMNLCVVAVLDKNVCVCMCVCMCVCVCVTCHLSWQSIVCEFYILDLSELVSVAIGLAPL